MVSAAIEGTFKKTTTIALIACLVGMTQAYAQTKAPLIGDRVALLTPAWVAPTKQERQAV